MRQRSVLLSLEPLCAVAFSRDTDRAAISRGVCGTIRGVLMQLGFIEFHRSFHSVSAA